jgi:activator of HSP90 ATPase
MNPNPFAALPTRRQALTGIAAALAAASLAQAQQPATEEKPATDANKARTAIHYEINFKHPPQRLYQAILDQAQFAAFTGLAATIDPAPGGAFSLFGGLVVGRNIELVPDQHHNPRIVQAWRPTHWDAGVYSIVHFEFTPHGLGTALIFDHTGFPAGDYDSLDSGWQSHYWEPLRKFLA